VASLSADLTLAAKNNVFDGDFSGRSRSDDGLQPLEDLLRRSAMVARRGVDRSDCNAMQVFRKVDSTTP